MHIGSTWGSFARIIQKSPLLFNMLNHRALTATEKLKMDSAWLHDDDDTVNIGNTSLLGTNQAAGTKRATRGTQKIYSLFLFNFTNK